ncbi:enterobactin synthetase component F [Thozetella sp. PMI_491]|nr:enterobactin synthetase component F [Thozetella sp. PMI_491]
MGVLDITQDLAALFVQQAKATPDALALEDGGVSYTYAELERETAVTAGRLREYGVGRNDLVGVLLGRSADYVIACLAALRAGGGFLVLELAYPPSLLADVIEDAKPVVVVTHAAHTKQIKASVPLIVLDQDQNGGANGHAREPSPLPANDDLERTAFVSYSSGTTGRPKGIVNPHRAPVLSYDLRFAVSDLEPGDRVACNVFFVWEILRPLLRGATVVAVPDEASYDPVALVDLLASRHITETLMTPTLLATLLSRHSKLGARLPELKTLWLNGEVVTTDLARRARKVLPNTRLLNCYSASETHEIACGDIGEILAALDEGATVCPVGPSLVPKHTYILDESGGLVEPGTSGELWIGGDLLAHGYLNLPETTEKSFKPDHFDGRPGARMYQTGDLARILPSGLLEITGRVGAMIKLRGYSIQPGAVENTIVQHIGVRQCAIAVHGDGLERQLVAYMVRDQEDIGERAPLAIDESGYNPAARKALVAHLAHYMIPALWVEVEELPRHEVSGKIDLKSLPPPPTPKSRSPTRSPTAATNKRDSGEQITPDMIAELWAASLNVPPSAVTEDLNFFDLGGHSLSLADLANRLSKTFGFPVPLGPLAGNPTLQGHVEFVAAARHGHVTAVQADLPAVLRADSILPDEIKPPADAKLLPLKQAQTILLTGVTGFLGGFLLHDLLQKTSAQIICLVRFNDPHSDDQGAGMSRVRKNMLDLGVWHDSLLDRIEVLPGNLGRKRLGLSQDIFDSLASRVQVIVHGAATVNLVYPYAALRDANVGGTCEILRLASQAGATVHHVSTNGVLPPSLKGWPEDANTLVEDVPEKLLDGYSETKWVAEQLVLEAGRRGLPVRIYRPGTISGHSSSGSTNTYDLLTAVIVESVHIGHYPEIDGWHAEMTPVDFVSNAILTLANHTGEEGHSNVFHIGDPAPVSARDLFASLEGLGYATKPLPWDEWMALWSKERGSSRRGGESFTAEILRGSTPTMDLFQSIIVLDTAKTSPILKLYGLERPPIDAKLWATYTRHFFARGWLPRPPQRMSPTNDTVKGPLAGRTAVIIGASSGIGAAIAVAVSQAGANVALGARRLNALESLKDRIIGGGGKAITHATDVTDRSQVESIVRAAGESFGAPADILVVCAGVMYYTMMANANTAQWDQTVDVNCKGLLNCLSTTVPGMISRGKGHIVSISSDAGRKVFPGLGVYSASKFFVEATLQSLRLETVGSGLRVTSVQPGNTATELLGLSTDAEAIEKYGTPTGAKVLDAEDVAKAVVYALCQPEHVAVNEVLIEPRDEPI